MLVTISQTAQEQLDHIVEYLEKRWSVKVKDNFINKLIKARVNIAQRPLSYPEAQNFPGLRKCVITSQTIAYYRVKQAIETVEIIAVIDARQDF